MRTDSDYEGHLQRIRELEELLKKKERERKKEKRARRSAELLYGELMTACIDAFVIADETGKILAWNPAAERLFGWTASEAIGRDCGDLLVPPAERAHHRAAWQRFMETGEAHVMRKRRIVEALCKQGKPKAVEICIWAVRVNRHFQFAALMFPVERLVSTDL